MSRSKGPIAPAPQLVEGDREPPYIDGDELVVYSETVLPPVCVKTNVPVSETDVREQKLTWCSPFIGVLILLSGPLLILVYFLVRKKCKLTYGLAPAIRSRQRMLKILKALACLLLFVAMIGVSALDNAAIIGVTLVLFLGSIVALFVGNSPLNITRHEKGKFWVRGFSPDYLNSLPRDREGNLSTSEPATPVGDFAQIPASG